MVFTTNGFFEVAIVLIILVSSYLYFLAIILVSTYLYFIINMITKEAKKIKTSSFYSRYCLL